MSEPKTITIAIASDADTLDPHKAEDAVSLSIVNQYAEGFCHFADDSLRVEPGLAEKWSSSADFRTWTFHLRHGVVFSDGSPLTGTEVVASFADTRAFGGKANSPDAERVVFQLDEPNAQFPEMITQLYFSIVKTSGAGKIGTGPYRLESRKVGREIVFVRNERYWRTAPKIERIVFRVIPYTTLLSKALVDGGVDMTDAVTPSMLSVLRTAERVRLEYQMGLNTGFLGINTERPPLNNVRLRLAIDSGIDRALLIQRFFPTGYGEPAQGLEPKPFQLPGTPAGSVFDREKAKRLVVEAGYRGEPLRLFPSWAPRPYMPDPPGIANEVARMLQAIGLNVKDEPSLTLEQFFERQKTGDYEMILSGWIADDTIPANFLADNLASHRIGRTNIARFRNATFDSAVAKMRRTSGAERDAAHREAVALIAREMPIVPLFHGPQIAAATSRVVGKLLHPSSNLRIWSLGLA